MVNLNLIKMKNIKYLILAILAVSIWSCKPEKFEPITTDLDVVKHMQGTWTVTSVIQVDENAKTQGFPYKTLDITNIYPYKEMVISLQGDANGNPGTFTITSGNSPKLSDLSSGTWSVDNMQAPTVITLKNGTAQAQLNLTTYAGLKAGKLNIKKVKRAGGKDILSYQYEFVKK